MVNLNPTTTFWTNCVVFNWNPEGRPLLDMSVIFFAGVLLTVGLKEGKPPFWEFPPPFHTRRSMLAGLQGDPFEGSSCCFELGLSLYVYRIYVFVDLFID